MAKRVVSKEEREYLEKYDISAFDRPSVTADIVVFAVNEEGLEEENYRKDPVRELQVLLVKRGNYPFLNCWALPGGFSVKLESTEETARRELYEETGVSDAFLRPFGIFSRPDRDPRGWILSHGYLALIDGGKYRLRAGTDAWEAAWFRLSVNCSEISRCQQNKDMVIEKLYELRFYQAEQELEMLSKVKETVRFTGLHRYLDYEILETGGLAFDHAQIILNAWQTLHREAEGSGQIVFDLMPEKFTLNSLQRAFELVLGRPLLVANFRRKIAPLVVETQEEITGVGHRPAKLFERKAEEFLE